MEIKGFFFQFEVIIDVLVQLNTYVMCLRPLYTFYSFCAGIDCRRQNQTSESDFYRRQILTSKLDPHSEKLNIFHAISLVDQLQS